MDESSKKDFETKKSALIQYVQGSSFAEIKKLTQVSRQHLHYLIKRCTEIDDIGNTLGYFGLIKIKCCVDPLNPPPKAVIKKYVISHL